MISSWVACDRMDAARLPTSGDHLTPWVTMSAALPAATWALYNHAVGSAASQCTLRISDAERRLGQEQLRNDRERYPTLAAHGYLHDDDCLQARLSSSARHDHNSTSPA
jgi:hypothetical protein